jgi:hypothetical protein
MVWVFFSVMNFVGYQYQKERERELMGEWLKWVMEVMEVLAIGRRGRRPTMSSRNTHLIIRITLEGNICILLSCLYIY